MAGMKTVALYSYGIEFALRGQITEFSPHGSGTAERSCLIPNSIRYTSLVSEVESLAAKIKVHIHCTEFVCEYIVKLITY